MAARGPPGRGRHGPEPERALWPKSPSPSGNGALWVASALTEADRLHASAGAVATGQASLKLRTVAVAPEIGRAAYDVIANGTLWFLHHGLFDHARRPRFDRVWHEAWDWLPPVQRGLRRDDRRGGRPGATVVVNDYHLALVGRYLARRRPDLATVFFCHTPFCPPEDLAMFPDEARLS